MDARVADHGFTQGGAAFHANDRCARAAARSRSRQDRPRPWHDFARGPECAPKDGEQRQFGCSWMLVTPAPARVRSNSQLNGVAPVTDKSSSETRKWAS